MFEKVNPAHPDKIADRIAGALVDLAYTKDDNARIAAEVLVGHRRCYVIIESNVRIPLAEVNDIVERIAGKDCFVRFIDSDQDAILSTNQKDRVRCGDNGIFKGEPVTDEQKKLTEIAKDIYEQYPTDGKYLIDGDRLVICQSNASSHDLMDIYPDAVINPLGEWTGGLEVDSGATNRKLGSDMGDAVTGGGLHGKDLSKADVSVAIYAHVKAQATLKPVELSCAIGDEYVDGRPYSEIVEIARAYIKGRGGFEKLAEWGLIC